MAFPRTTSRASPCSGATPSPYNSAAHYGGYYEERGGRGIDTVDGHGRGGESANRYRFRGETSSERYRLPPTRRVSDAEIPDISHDQRENQDHNTYQNARQSSPYEYGELRNHHHYRHPLHQQQHGYSGPRPPCYEYHGQGGSSNSRPVERYNYQASHSSRAPYSKGFPSEYGHGRHDQSPHYPNPNLADLSPPTLVESETSDDYGGASDPYHYNQDRREDPYWNGKPTPGEASRKPPPPPPLQEKVAGIKTVEVAPGVHMRLRGADETWRAIEVDFYMPSECICCASTIFVIQDADFVLCPDCRVVSPMDGKEFDGVSDGGVGLGFRMEDLAKWQEDIERQRRTNQRM